MSDAPRLRDYLVDFELVWDTVQQDLPKLHERITGILRELR